MMLYSISRREEEWRRMEDGKFGLQGVAEVFKTLEETGMDKEFWPQAQKWLDRGDGIAVYQNAEMGHSNCGHRKFCSFGSKQAQLENCDFPPQRMPDIGDQINWRYILVGIIPMEIEHVDS